MLIIVLLIVIVVLLLSGFTLLAAADAVLETDLRAAAGASNRVRPRPPRILRDGTCGRASHLLFPS